MVQLVLDDRQTKLVEEARSTVEVVDAKGRLIVRLPPTLSDSDLARIRAERARPHQRHTTAEVLEHLRGLER